MIIFVCITKMLKAGYPPFLVIKYLYITYSTNR